MFKTFSTMIVLNLLALSAVEAQSVQPLQAKVPFTFTVQNMTLAAGNYRLTYSPTAHILSIRGLDQNSGGAFIHAMQSADADGPGKIVFNCYEGSCYLAKVWPGAGGRGLQVPQGERQRKLSLQTRVVSMTTAPK